MSGLLGWGGAYEAMHNWDLLLLLGTAFPFTDFYPTKPKKVQVDRRGTMLGRRTRLDMALVGDVRDTVAARLPMVSAKPAGHHLSHALGVTEPIPPADGPLRDRGLFARVADAIGIAGRPDRNR